MIESADCVKILELGAEGGSLTLLGLQGSDGAWQYMLHCNEAALAEEEETESATSNSAVVTSWPEAIELLNKYEIWHNLYPLKVHQDFSNLVISEVRSRGGDKAVFRWENWLNRQ